MRSHQAVISGGEASVMRLILLWIAVSLTASGFSARPPVRRTGAPGDANCTVCHTGTANAGPGAVRIELVGGTNYQPGVPVLIRAIIADRDAKRFGFSMAARPNTDLVNGRAGSFLPADTRTQVFCSNLAGNDIGPKTGAECPTSQPLEFPMQTREGAAVSANPPGTATFDLRWTPPATDVGPVTFYIAANAANADGDNTGDRIYLSSLVVPGPGSGPAAAKPQFLTSGVVNAATGLTANALAPGSFFSIFGENLSTQFDIWTNYFVNGRAPTELRGVRVLINDRPAFLSYISASQINGIVPEGIAPGTATVVVVNNGIRSDPIPAQAVAVAPAFFTYTTRTGKYAAAISASNEILAPPFSIDIYTTSRAAVPGEVIVLYGSGMGLNTDPPVAPGTLPSRPALLRDPVTVRIGNRTAPVQFAGMPSGLAGLFQINTVVPADLPNGDHPITVTINGQTSPVEVTLPVERP